MRVGRLQFAQAGTVERAPVDALPSSVPADVPSPRRIPPVALHIGVLLLFTVLTTIATWPLFPQLGGYVMDKGDPLYSVWAVAWQDHALITNPAGLFDANILYPFRGTLTFDELGFTEALMAAPLYYLTANPVLSHNFVLFISFILSGYTMWLLVRELSGSNRAGVVAGVAFAFCFYRLDHLPHITLDSTEFIPLVLLATYKLLWTRRWAWAVALGGFFALQALAGHYLAFYTAMLLALFVAYYALAQRRVFSLNFLLKMAAGLLGSLVFILPIAVPYIQDQGHYDFGRSIFEAERFSNTLSSFLAVFRGSPVYQALFAPFSDPGPWSIERSAFPGFFVLLLAVAGVVLAFRRRDRRRISRDESTDPEATSPSKGPLKLHAGFFMLAAVLSALLSLGPSLQITYAASVYDPNAIQRVMPLPYLLLHTWVPGFSSMRVVARISLIMQMSLAVLAGFGAFLLLGALYRRVRSNRVARSLVPVVAALVAFLPVAESWSAPVSMAAVGTRSAVPPVYTWLAQQPHTVILEYPMTYYKPGDPDVEMENLNQYYSVYHWDDTINGSTTIKPFSYSALVEETVACFPCPRSLGAMHAMGVQYVVVHLADLSGPQRTDFLWRATAPAAKVFNDFKLVQSFGSDRVYALTGPNDAETIAGLLPPGSSLLLADPQHDPEKQQGALVSGGYVAALGWYLRAHPEFGDSHLSFGQTITAYNAQRPPDFALLWANEDPALFGYRAQDKVWVNEQVALYRRAPGAASVGARP